jgi:hypothetical protein
LKIDLFFKHLVKRKPLLAEARGIVEPIGLIDQRLQGVSQAASAPRPPADATSPSAA